MNAFEKSFYEKAKVKGIRLFEEYDKKVVFALNNNEHVKITYSNPSKEFIKLMKEIYEE